MTEGKRPLRIHGRDPRLLDALRAAGIVRENDYVRRVIIDIDVTSAPVIYVERYGDERLLDLIRTLDGTEIRTGHPAEDKESTLDGTEIRTGHPAEDKEST